MRIGCKSVGATGELLVRTGKILYVALLVFSTVDVGMFAEEFTDVMFENDSSLDGLAGISFFLSITYGLYRYMPQVLKEFSTFVTENVSSHASLKTVENFVLQIVTFSVTPSLKIWILLVILEK